jgi:3,5-epimerase/4-reductase
MFGGNGWIGGMVKKVLRQQGEVVVDARSRADDEDGIVADIEYYDPDRILCLVGRTHGPGYSTIDYLEQKGKLVENVRDNLFAPVALALIASNYGLHLTYLGTGCIFTYK